LVGKSRLLQTDVDLIARLLENPDAYGADPREFAGKILRALYANESEKAIAATRGGIFAYAGLGVGIILGPYDTLDAAREDARNPNLGEFKWLYPARMVHPFRYKG